MRQHGTLILYQPRVRGRGRSPKSAVKCTQHFRLKGAQCQVASSIPGLGAFRLLGSDAVFKGLTPFPRLCCLGRPEEATLLKWHLQLAVTWQLCHYLWSSKNSSEIRSFFLFFLFFFGLLDPMVKQVTEASAARLTKTRPLISNKGF